MASAYGFDIWELLYNYNGNKTWLMDNPGFSTEIIKLGLEDNNMFFRPQFLHNESLVKQEDITTNGVVGSVKPGGVYGNVDFENTVLPMLPYSSGLLVIALDPTRKLSDNNRTDNVFIEFIHINTTEWKEPEPFCSVTTRSLGKFARLRRKHHIKSI